MKARKSVLLVATLLCSVAPVCAMEDAMPDEAVNAVEMDVAMPEANDGMGMADVEEDAGEVEQLSQEKMVKKPVATEFFSEEAPMAEVVMEETVAPADVTVEAEEVSANGDDSADVRGVFEEMSREEASDEAEDEADHIG